MGGGLSGAAGRGAIQRRLVERCEDLLAVAAVYPFQLRRFEGAGADIADRFRQAFRQGQGKRVGAFVQPIKHITRGAERQIAALKHAAGVTRDQTSFNIRQCEPGSVGGRGGTRMSAVAEEFFGQGGGPPPARQAASRAFRSRRLITVSAI